AGRRPPRGRRRRGAPGRGPRCRGRRGPGCRRGRTARRAPGSPGRLLPGGGVAVAPGPGEPVPGGGGRDEDAGEQHGGHLVTGARPGEDAGAGELGGAGRPAGGAGGRRPPVTGGGEGAGGGPGGGDRGVAADPSAGGDGLVPPVGSVQAPHQRVVGVAALLLDGGPAGGGPHGVPGGAAALPYTVSGAEDAQGEVGVLAEGPREAFVEAADLLEDRGAVGHVGGDPAGPGESGRAAFPVGGAAPAGQRHGDDALHGGDVGGRLGEVPCQLFAPAGADLDVVVEEGDPGRTDGAQPGVAGGGGSASAAGADGGPVPQVAEDAQRVVERGGVGGGAGAVVDEDDLVGARAGRGGQRAEAVGEGVPHQGGDHDGVRGHA